MKFLNVIIPFLIVFLWVTSAPGKTRWSSNHIIPDADFQGSGELIVGYDGFLNMTADGDGMLMLSQFPVSLGVSEWLTASISWSDGVALGFKARVLDEYLLYMPSVAVGVRNLYHNSILARSRVENDSPEVIGEVYLALSKGFDLITTRFHGGISSFPSSETEQINGFFGVEKYFGHDFYVTLEGWSFYDRLNLALFGTFRFLPKRRGEIYLGLIDLERLFFSQDGDFEMSLESDFGSDVVKPGVSIGINLAFSFPFGSQTQFRTVEDLYREHQNELDYLRNSQDSLRNDLQDGKSVVDSLKGEITLLASKVVDQDIPPLYFEEIYARLLLYRNGYESKPFDPEGIRKIRTEIFAFNEHAEQSLIRIVTKGDRNRKIEMDAVSLLGMMHSMEAVPLLIEKLGSEKDRRYKIEIISALGTIGDRGAAYALKHLANSGDESIAVAAAEVLSLWEQESEPASVEQAEEFVIE